MRDVVQELPHPAVRVSVGSSPPRPDAVTVGAATSPVRGTAPGRGTARDHSYSVPPLRVRYAGLTAFAMARPPVTGL